VPEHNRTRALKNPRTTARNESRDGRVPPPDAQAAFCFRCSASKRTPFLHTRKPLQRPASLEIARYKAKRNHYLGQLQTARDFAWGTMAPKRIAGSRALAALRGRPRIGTARARNHRDRPTLSGPPPFLNSHESWAAGIRRRLRRLGQR